MSNIPAIVGLGIGVMVATRGSGGPNSEILWMLGGIILMLEGIYWKIHETRK